MKAAAGDVYVVCRRGTELVHTNRGGPSGSPMLTTVCSDLEMEEPVVLPNVSLWANLLNRTRINMLRTSESVDSARRLTQ